MKKETAKKIQRILILLPILFAPAISMGQPAGPGDGSDPFATPVNGYVAVVAVIAFLFGAYRLYRITKSNSAGRLDR